MHIDFDYKVLDIKNYLTDDEFNKLQSLINDFNLDVNDIKSALGFLQWGESVQNKLIEKDNNRFEKICNSYNVTYDDYLELKKLNDEFGFGQDDYFNFLLTYRIEILKEKGIYPFLSTAYQNILFELFGKKFNQTFRNLLFGHINVYPEGSFIKKHSDNDPTNERLFTSIFFLNNNRTLDDGSILKLYTKDGEIDIIPDIRTCVLLENSKINYVHEVTKNNSKNIRYSIYSPFTIKDYEEKLTNP